ncbi:MAG TPA: hypothetical protein PK156_42690 [Polyangium sp.]|nr:hypothetical protein [Polyangium sp.]
MFRALSPILCAVSLLVGLAACDSLGRDLVGHSRCFVFDDPNYKTGHFECCDEYTPRDHPACLDGGADAGTDASDDGDVDAGADDGGPPADEVCPWACTPVGGAGFDPFPSYVWFGEEGAVPPPPLTGFEFKSWVDVDLKVPPCPTCSCIAPTNPNDGCVLPAVWSVESKVCQELSSPSVTPFDPPANWAGSCTSTNPIAEGVMCEGEPCAKSLVVQPPTIAPCVADPVMPPEGEPVGPPAHKQVIEYVSAPMGPSCDSTSTCIAPPAASYKLCFVANDIDVAVPCPDGWTDQYVGWREVTNKRVCSACTCGLPTGASCEVRATVYADDACTDTRGDMMLLSNEAAICVDLTVGTALGSKTAEILSYQAGICAPSTSEIIGELELKRPVTYCCLPALPIPP